MNNQNMHYMAAIWTPKLDGDGTGNFPNVKAGDAVRVEVLKSSLNGQRKIGGNSVCTIRPLGSTKMSEVFLSEVKTSL